MTFEPTPWGIPSTKTIRPADIEEQASWSRETFGPGFRSGVFRHLEEEVKEAEEHPHDVSEWADLLILTIDGATRAGHSGADLIEAYHAKRLKNTLRDWPDWRTMSPDQPINHVRTEPLDPVVLN